MMPSGSVDVEESNDSVAGAIAIGAETVATASGEVFATVVIVVLADPVAPSLSVTVKVTIKVRAVVKVCDGLAAVPRTVPSDQFQLYATIEPSASPDPAELKLTVRGAFPETGDGVAITATGDWLTPAFTTTATVELPIAPPLSVTRRVATKVPPVV
jgi:hypothetical protein